MTIWLIISFIVGYAAIASEEYLGISKTAFALLLGVFCWAILLVFNLHEPILILESLDENIGGAAAILFFLLGAMTVVELIDAHQGFEIITSQIKAKGMVSFVFVIAIATFFLSAALENLTTSIVMVSILKKMLPVSKTRKLLAGLVIIVANAGGAWSPIGDVTTTMLWIGGQVSADGIVSALFIPSVVCTLIPVLRISQNVRKERLPDLSADKKDSSSKKVKGRDVIFYVGITGVLLVPILKVTLHLPPVMGMLGVLSVLWLIIEIMHRRSEFQERKKFTAAYALSRIDSSSILFFLGILLAVGALETAGVLHITAEWLATVLPGEELLAISMGLLSAIVDNVPLTAAVMGMYDIHQYPIDSHLWHLMAYAAGTGGSALIIGSAAGVAVMGLEEISFGWYLKKMSLPALIGFFAGLGVYVLLQQWR